MELSVNDIRLLTVLTGQTSIKTMQGLAKRCTTVSVDQMDDLDTTSLYRNLYHAADQLDAAGY
jgi:hypothetical protein